MGTENGIAILRAFEVLERFIYSGEKPSKEVMEEAFFAGKEAYAAMAARLGGVEGVLGEWTKLTANADWMARIAKDPVQSKRAAKLVLKTSKMLGIDVEIPF